MNDVQVQSLLTIFREVRLAGATYQGALGLLGNLWAESGLVPTNLQNSYEKKFALSDSVYTEKVDNGQYTNFVKDSAGYGLAQWTYWSRKQALLNYCKAKGTSIGDLNAQVGFMIQELKGYKSVWSVLTTTHSIKEASDSVLTGYEKPADQSDAAKEKRAGYAEEMKRQLLLRGFGESYAETKKDDDTAQEAVDYKAKYEALLSKIRKIAEEV